VPIAESPTLAVPLARVIGRLRRSLNRRTRTETGRPPIAEAQLEVLRLVERHPSTRVQDLAGQLGLASNTVSTLVHQLIGSGLVERGVDAADGRVALLQLTPAGQERLCHWRDVRQEILAAELDGLREPDQRALEAALPALERLADALEAGWRPAAARALPEEITAHGS